MDEIKKKVDENYKEQVAKEKEAPGSTAGFRPPDPDFKFFATTLALQAAVSLGNMPNPATDKVEQDLIQAKFLIDTLGMLQEKTKGNLDKEEAGLLENMLYELRTQYISASKEGK